MNLILFGFQGVGKTTLGKRLAQRVGASFCDTDELIIKRLGKYLSCKEIVQKEGDPFFRTLEKEVVSSLRAIRGSVIALGGGTLMEADNRNVLLRLGQLVYLHADESRVKKWSRRRLTVFESLPAKPLLIENKTEEEIVNELEEIWQEITLEPSLRS